MRKCLDALDAASRTLLQDGRHYHPRHQFRTRYQYLFTEHRRVGYGGADDGARREPAN